MSIQDFKETSFKYCIKKGTKYDNNIIIIFKVTSIIIFKLNIRLKLQSIFCILTIFIYVCLDLNYYAFFILSYLEDATKDFRISLFNNRFNFLKLSLND